LETLFDVLAVRDVLQTRRKGLIDEAMAAIADEIEHIDTQMAKVKAQIDGMVAEDLAALRRDKSTGVVKFVRDGVEVKETVSKVVTWDQIKLQEIHHKIKSAGDNPDEYIGMKLSVAESAFKAWPAMIKKIFEPARTVKPGKPSLSFKVVKEK